MIIISKLPWIRTTSPLIIYCQIYYKKDGDITLKFDSKFNNEGGDYLLLKDYYLYSILKKEDYDKAVNLKTGKEIYFSDLVKTNKFSDNSNLSLDKKEVSYCKKEESIWKKISNQLKGIFL